MKSLIKHVLFILPLYILFISIFANTGELDDLAYLSTFNANLLDEVRFSFSDFPIAAAPFILLGVTLAYGFMCGSMVYVFIKHRQDV